MLDDKMLNETLRLIRKYHGVRQKDLAPQVGVARTHLSGIERGKKGVSPKVLKMYSLIFNMSFASIFILKERLEKKNVEFEVSPEVGEIYDWAKYIDKVSKAKTSV